MTSPPATGLLQRVTHDVVVRDPCQGRTLAAHFLPGAGLRFRFAARELRRSSGGAGAGDAGEATRRTLAEGRGSSPTLLPISLWLNIDGFRLPIAANGQVAEGARDSASYSWTARRRRGAARRTAASAPASRGGARGG